MGSGRACLKCSSCHLSTSLNCARLLLSSGGGCSWVLLGYSDGKLLAKWPWDHRRTLCVESPQRLLRTAWHRVSWPFSKPHIWWQANTNPDQSAGFQTGPISQPLRPCAVGFHFHWPFLSTAALCLHTLLQLLCSPSFALPLLLLSRLLLPPAER